jgi:hypothetical protein
VNLEAETEPCPLHPPVVNCEKVAETSAEPASQSAARYGVSVAAEVLSVSAYRTARAATSMLFSIFWARPARGIRTRAVNAPLSLRIGRFTMK